MLFGRCMTNAFVRKLEYGARLTDEDRALLAEAVVDARVVRPRQDVVRQGDVPVDVNVILDGFACRYKVLADGKRQIMAFLIPGDMCDLHVHVLGWMDHSIATLTECLVAKLPPATIARLIANPRINRALWWATLADEATLREWLVNMGQRPADHQLAHLICELLTRLKAVGLALDNRFDLPCTQDELADAMGLTPVHVNRMLRQLREQALIETNGRRVGVPDFARLADFAGFDVHYLHLRQPRGGMLGDPGDLSRSHS